jgi:hypothetical protein
MKGYWDRESLSMVSELNFPVTAQIVLFDRHGAQITSQTIAFPAHSRQVVLVADMLRLANSGETMGSAEILPDPAKVVTMAIAAQLSIDGSGANIGQHIEEEFLMADAQSSGVLRSAGASLVGNPVVALKNTIAAAQTATISCITEKGGATHRQVKLGAGEWALLQACASSPSAAVSLINEFLVPRAKRPRISARSASRWPAAANPAAYQCLAFPGTARRGGPCSVPRTSWTPDSTGRGDGSQSDLRRGLSGILLRVPAKAKTARCVGCTGSGPETEEGELDSGLRRSWLFGSYVILPPGY